MTRTRALPLAFALVLAACGQEGPTSGATAAAAATTAAPNPGASATATATASAATAAATQAATAAPAAAPLSAEPTVEEWEAAKLDLEVVKNGVAMGCFGRRIREWVRIGCSAAKSVHGAPVGIQLVKGFLPSKMSILKERNGSIMLVFPAQVGMDAEASVSFADASLRLTARWPSGQPEPKPLASLDEVASPTKYEGSPTVAKDALPAEPTIEGAPAAKEWETTAEVGVKGSSALGCDTRQIGDWFRMVCRANDNTGKAVSGAAISGFDDKKGYVVSGNGSFVVLTQFVKGSDIAVDLAWEKTFGRLTLLWPKDMGRKPAIQGELVPRL